MGEKPNLMKMKVFGCTAFVQIPKSQRRGKLNPTAWQGMMVGYSTNSPEWIILDNRTNKLRKANSVVFHENVKGALQQAQVSPKEIAVNEYEIPQLTLSECSESYDNGNEIAMTNDTESDDIGELPRHEPFNEDVTLNEYENEHNNYLRRGTRARQQLNPNYMPSGTLEMEKLNNLIENDSTSSEDRESDPRTGHSENIDEIEYGTEISETFENTAPQSEDIDEHSNEQLYDMTEENEPPASAAYHITENQLLSLGLCMAMTMTEELPRT